MRSFGTLFPVLSRKACSPKLCGGNSTTNVADAGGSFRTSFGGLAPSGSNFRFSKTKSQTSKSSGRTHETRNSTGLRALSISAQIFPRSAIVLMRWNAAVAVGCMGACFRRRADLPAWASGCFFSRRLRPSAAVVFAAEVPLRPFFVGI